MLKTLERIIQKVNGASDFRQSLQIIVCEVKKALDSDACSLFLTDNQRSRYVLMATEGLNPDQVGKLSIDLGKGLIGQVGEREEPINLEDATGDEHYLAIEGAGEEPYRAFLAAPITHHRKLFGVIAVQQKEIHRFDPSEEAFLLTICAQIAGVIAHAEAVGELNALLEPEQGIEDTLLTGIPGVPGVGIGRAVIVYPPADLEAVPDRQAENTEEEISLFNLAVASVREEMELLDKRLSPSLPEKERDLFVAYRQMLDPESLGDEVTARIREGHWAQGSLRHVVRKYISQFESLDNEYMRERAADIRDIGRRVLSKLQSGGASRPTYAENTILVGEEISATDLAEVPEGCLAGVVSGSGSSASHVAILARALGVATVMGVENLAVGKLEKQELIVDGYYGQVYVAPSATLSREFKRLADEERELDKDLEELHTEPAQTLDGHRIALHVNTGLASDIGLSLSAGAEGVGLYRTEVPFMLRDRFPSGDEQYVIYRQLLGAFAPRPVTMRVLDVGGDKSLPYFPINEENPFLGWRGIRILLDHPDIFLVQIRSMLRASEGHNNLQIMLPMVSDLSEVDEAVRLINKAYSEVCKSGLDIAMPKLGVMIEVPSAVFQIKAIAEKVDFISVGTNDLTQYLLAVDRNNSRVAGLYDSLHPSVLHALQFVVENTHAVGKTACICGELAADPVAVVLLLAMGYDCLSMNATSLPRMKWVVRCFTLNQARALLNEVMAMDSGLMVRNRIELALEQLGLGGLVRAGR